MWREKDRKPQPQTAQARPATGPWDLETTDARSEQARVKLPLTHTYEGSDNSMSEVTPKSAALGSTTHRQTLLGSSVVLKGELSGDEDLTIDGQFDGTINVKDNCLTIGQHGQVKADVNARQGIISGKLTGKINARDKVEIHKTGNVVGDLVTMGVAIEEGAYFKGSIEILRDEENAQAKAAASSWTS
jgi:cytoskeletal protein CcmA (bactofilin family)